MFCITENHILLPAYPTIIQQCPIFIFSISGHTLLSIFVNTYNYFTLYITLNDGVHTKRPCQLEVDCSILETF